MNMKSCKYVNVNMQTRKSLHANQYYFEMFTLGISIFSFEQIFFHGPFGKHEKKRVQCTIKVLDIAKQTLQAIVFRHNHIVLSTVFMLLGKQKNVSKI